MLELESWKKRLKTKSKMDKRMRNERRERKDNPPPVLLLCTVSVKVTAVAMQMVAAMARYKITHNTM